MTLAISFFVADLILVRLIKWYLGVTYEEDSINS